ncbi:hypothetical protein CBW65_03755 [Tumebacillus avium]|uniref:Major facilitator superfamily (MFS) profile domain-containing protein n=1 Tax=Tumebacillus avium TaxID=1903704 RepID=A0A1Y0IKB5_9BACL|nr:hypothetical protein [Tumebacillus avium]ARU60276.1 hypothetical protein CBW65_03755 [Tumebacillus avium]
MLHLLTVALFTCCSCLSISCSKQKISPMTGMILAMTAAMLSSFCLGVLLAAVWQFDLAVATMLSISFGLLIGILAGQPISPFAKLDGLIAGIMGGAMGPMLGAMLPAASGGAFLWFLDLLLLLVLFLSLKWKKAS